MIICLVAVDQNQGIGFNNSMPWPRLDSDMSWFKDRTENNVVLMGSNTWKSLKAPLRGRVNVVISSILQPSADITLSDPVDALTELVERYKNKDICVIGGEAIYESVKHLIEIYYVTEIDATYDCDKHFDLTYVKSNYKNVETLLEIESTDITPSYKIKEYKK